VLTNSNFDFEGGLGTTGDSLLFYTGETKDATPDGTDSKFICGINTKSRMTVDGVLYDWQAESNFYFNSFKPTGLTAGGFARVGQRQKYKYDAGTGEENLRKTVGTAVDLLASIMDESNWVNVPTSDPFGASPTFEVKASFTWPTAACAVNTYCAVGSSTATCTACSGMTACTAGKYYDSSGDPCAQLGSIADTVGGSSASCKNCPRGKYASPAVASLVQCKTCAGGKYTDSTGQSSCKSCGAGRYVATDATVCIGCNAGKFAATTENTNSGQCKDCEGAQYTDSDGQSSCKSCGAGKYAVSTGCIGCDAGKFAVAAVGSEGECTNCEAGQHSSSIGSDSCTSCPAAKYPNSNK
jgi:hypothetical protein